MYNGYSNFHLFPPFDVTFTSLTNNSETDLADKIISTYMQAFVSFTKLVFQKKIYSIMGLFKPSLNYKEI